MFNLRIQALQSTMQTLKCVCLSLHSATASVPATSTGRGVWEGGLGLGGGSRTEHFSHSLLINLSQLEWLQHSETACFAEPLRILLNCRPRAFFIFFLSNRPARLLSAYKDKEQFELLNTCFCKVCLKKLHHIPFDDCATQGGYLSWKLSKSELWAPLQFRHSFVPTWKIASCSQFWKRKSV